MLDGVGRGVGRGRTRRGHRRPPPRGHEAGGGGTAPRPAPHANSRRMTGNRGSSMARTNPAASQKAGVAPLVASGRVPSSGYASTAANPRGARSVADGLDEPEAVALAATRGDRRDAGDDGRQRRDRAGSGTGRGCAAPAGTRSAGRTGSTPTVASPSTQDLRVAARRRPSPRPSSRSLRGAVAGTAGPALGGGANGLTAASSSGVQERVRVRATAGRANGLRGRPGSRSSRNGFAGRGPARATRRGRLGRPQPVEPGRLRAARVVLPVVAGAMVEARVGARRNEREVGLIRDV